MKQKQVNFDLAYKGKLYQMIITENPSGIFLDDSTKLFRNPKESIEELLDPDVTILIYNHLLHTNLTDEDGNLL